MAGAMRRPLVAALSSFVAAATAQGYDPSRARLFANLAGAAYCEPETLTSWTCGPKCIDGVTDVQVCQGATTKSFVALWDGQCLVSIQGTHDWEAWVKDLEFVETATDWPGCAGCKVHGGFLSEWNSLKGCIMQQLANLGCPQGSPIRTTGHSLGAALNGLAMLDLSDNGWFVTESYDFGMPRTGDELFAASMSLRFGDRSFRVTHKKDPVPHVPPNHLIVDWHFEHKEPEIFYNDDDYVTYTECGSPDDDNCSHQFPDVPVDFQDFPDHTNYMGVHTGGKGCANGTATVVV